MYLNCFIFKKKKKKFTQKVFAAQKKTQAKIKIFYMLCHGSGIKSVSSICKVQFVELLLDDNKRETMAQKRHKKKERICDKT